MERNEPDIDPTSKSGIRRGKIKEGQRPVWVSQWIPWEPQMDVAVFVRNLKRELASQCFACRGEVERDLAARVLEARLESPDYFPSIPPVPVLATPQRVSSAFPATPAAAAAEPTTTTKTKKKRPVQDYETPAAAKQMKSTPRKRTCPNCHADTSLTACACCSTPKSSVSAVAGTLGKGKKLCRHCNSVIASSRKECPLCDTPCVSSRY